MRARWLFRPVCFRRQHRTRTHVIIATLTGALTVPLLFPVESRIYVTGSVSSSARATHCRLKTCKTGSPRESSRARPDQLVRRGHTRPGFPRLRLDTVLDALLGARLGKTHVRRVDCPAVTDRDKHQPGDENDVT